MAIDDFAIELKSYQETEVEADQTIDTVDLSITDPEPTETTSGSPSISDAGSGVPHEQISPDRLDHMDEDDDVVPSFPLEELDRLDDMIARIRWVVPVLPRGELEVLLLACIDLAKRGVDHKCEPCQKFIREGLTLSFQRILTDEAVSGWKYDIHRAIQRNCERLVDLCVVKVVHDSYPLLDLLAMVFNPSTKFQLVNSSRTSETLNASTQGGNQSIQALQDLDNFYALPPDLRTPRGWLVDIINRFGAKGGFQALTLRFNREDNLSVPLIFALLRPFGLASEFLTPNTIRRFFMPLVERIPTYLENLTDDELKKEAKLNVDIKNDALSSIVKWLRAFVLRLPPYPEQEETAKNLEIFRLKMILRLLEISSFNGKMNALNELNKAIASISYTHSRHSVDDDEWLTTERMARWIEENRVLQIILRDSLHQPQYVEKLEKIIRFSIKEKAMTTDDLDTIWAAQIGKHEAIVKNVHDLLAKLAWDFSPEQLDHLFECFQASWSHANQKQREKLLELIRRLAEDDKEGVMATKVLSLLWNLAHSEDLPTEIMDQALQAHRAILDYSCSQDRDSQKTVWLERCVAEVKEGRWVIPTLKQIREICRLYEESFTHTANYGSVNSGSAGMGPHHHIQGGSSGLYPGQHSSKGPQSAPRHEVITHLHNSHSLVVEVANNLEKYMSEAREYLKEHPEITDPTVYHADGRYNHNDQVNERLDFLKFLLKEGQLWLAEPQAQKIWRCLAQEGIFSSDREACFKWFSKLMGDEPDLDPEINRSFFETVILQFDPTLLTESGMKCFERFFKSVNAKEQKLILKRRNYQMNDYDLIGMDYIWRVIHNSGEEIANRAIELLREIHTNLGPKLQAQQVQLHEDFITSCMDRLRALYDTISILMTSDKDHESDVASKEKLTMEVVRVCRVLKVLYEYIVHCDYDYPVDRVFLPLARAYRGKAVTLTTRFQSQSRGTEDIEIWSHTNDSLGSVRRQIISRLKAQPAHTRVELYLGGEILERTDDRKLISQIPIRDKAHLTGKIVSAMPSSPDSSSDSSGAGGAGSPQHSVSGVVPGEMEPNLSAEKALPGYRMSQKREWTEFLFKLWDLGAALGNSVLRNSACGVLRLIPPDESIKEELVTACAEIAAKKEARSNVISGGHESLEEFYFGRSPSQVLYYLEVTYALLIPAAIMLRPVTELAEKFQRDFVRAGGVSVICRLLTDPNFMVEANYEVDGSALKAAFQTVTRLAKLLFTTVVHGLLSLKLPLEETRSPRKMEKLRQALSFIPNPTYDVFIRQVARELGEQMPVETSRVIPDEKVVYALIKLSWCAAYGRVECFKTATAETMKNFQREYQLRVTEAVELQRDQVDDDDQGQHNSFDSLSSRAPVIVGADQDDLYLCREALETLTVALAVCPENLDKLIYENEIWPSFVIDMLLLAPMKFVRIAVAEQMSLMAMRCCSEDALVKFIQPTLFSVLHTSTVTHHDGISHEYFNLLCRLLNYASVNHLPIPGAEELLIREISWLRDVRRKMMKLGLRPVSDTLLEGHLTVAKELTSFMTPEKKYELGLKTVDSEDCCTNLSAGDVSDFLQQEYTLLRDLLDNFLFPATRQLMAVRGRERAIPELTRGKLTTPVCNTRSTCIAAYDFLVALATGCVQNYQAIAKLITDMFYSENSSPNEINDWEFALPVGPRSSKGFVGLKNAGATCYMNSVMQQLFMVEPVRQGILSAEGAIVDPDEDFSGEDMRSDSIGPVVSLESPQVSEDLQSPHRGQNQMTEYNIGILKQIQAIFGHLAASRLQYYIPRGLWKQFRINGEPVNLREQHDAVEFYNSLVESLDEALKTLGHEQVMSRVLGGSYADQIICRGCPHRYSREAGFTVLIIDIRNHSNIYDSLENYVKGELLEGANAYYCEKCDKKVDTVKRMCIKKLPRVLTIQLKRFDYDWERESPVKFNDYFEFSRELDMEPYTVRGLAKLDGDVMQDEDDLIEETEGGGDRRASSDTSRYKLTGIVVHSGQASGGHYYSYILHGSNPAAAKWYKFDDGEVSESPMNDDEELKTQCFGGEYVGEVFDHMNKRMNCRRQKRWWNAYILFYTRLDEYKRQCAFSNRHQQLNLHNLQYQSHYQSVAGRHFSESGLGDDMDSICRPFSDMTLNECSPGFPKMPAPIERSVKLANMRFAHNLNQFQPEYFVFMKRLLSCNLYVPISMPQNQVGHEGMPLVSFIKRIAKPDEMEEAMLTTTVLGCKFLIRVGFRTKKSTRGNANDWQDILSTALKHSRRAREFLAYNVLLSPMLTRKAVMCEFLLECSTQEVRSAFGKLIAALAHACLVIDGSQVIHIAKKPIESSSSEIGSPEDFAAVPLTGEMTNTFLLKACLSMLDKEVPEHGRNLSQYFGLFHHYAMLGTKDKLQLLKLDVPRLFMQIATDEGPGQPIKYQFADLGKLFSTVSLLVRSCDVSSHCQSAPNSKTVKPLDNEYAEGEPVMQVPPSIVELLYSKQQYVKKIIEDAHASDDTLRLLQFASWENASFSSLVLGELLWQIAYSYSCELRPFLDLLFAMLTIKDTWQTHRIHNVLKGVGEEREGLLDTIQRSQSHFQKRAYMCIKWLVSLFEKCTIAFEMLNSVGDFKRKWNSVINWLHKELEGRPPYAGGQYSYAAWSPPAQSNETSTAYYVERSASARLLLEKAMTLCPEDEPDTEEQSEEPASDTPLIGGAPAEDEEDVEEEEEDERRPQFSFTVITSKKERLTPALFKEQKHFNYSLTDSTPLPSTLPHSAVLSPVLPFNNNNNNADNNNAPARFSQTGRGEELVETDRPEVRNIPINVESPDGSKWLMKGVLFTDPPPSPTEQEPPNK